MAVGVLTGALSQAEIECEEAMEYLSSCCEEPVTGNICGGSGCGGSTLPLEQSECIRASDCDELRAAGVCERVKHVDVDPSDGTKAAWVCP